MLLECAQMVASRDFIVVIIYAWDEWLVELEIGSQVDYVTEWHGCHWVRESRDTERTDSNFKIWSLTLLESAWLESEAWKLIGAIIGVQFHGTRTTTSNLKLEAWTFKLPVVVRVHWHRVHLWRYIPVWVLKYWLFQDILLWTLDMATMCN